MKLTLEKMSAYDFRRRLAQVIEKKGTVVIIEKLGQRKGVFVPWEIAKAHFSEELRKKLAELEKKEVENLYGIGEGDE